MKKICRISRILIILIILVILSFFNFACSDKKIEDNKIKTSSDLSDYSINKAIEVNSLDNLTKETGYFSFNLVPMEKDLNACVAYAHDKYLIFDLKDSDVSIVTDKSSSYIIENNIVKEHRKLNNYDQNSFLIDKSLHDTDIEVAEFEGKIFHKFLSSQKNCTEKLNYLNKSFPEIFHFDVDKYAGLFISYYLYKDSYELFGYNVIASIEENDFNTALIYMIARTKKNIEESEKKHINNLIKLINDYKE